MQKRRLSLPLLALLALLALLSSPTSRTLAAQTLSAEARAQALLETLAPEERVGQLFLIHVDGADTSPESDIYDLVVNHHVGGVVLRADHDNFPGVEDPSTTTLNLVSNLQQIEWLSTQQTFTDTVSGETFTPAFIPLFVGITQAGDGPPLDQIAGGLTRLPSPMAIGATWNPELAELAGIIAGHELSALGINLLMGPSLDVLENPNPESGGDLGVRTFGGDPFWVAQMGSAYIRGVHAGSEQRMAVIGKHFPGIGSSDRPIEEEVSTVRKSLEQLKQIELAPFFYVTGDAPDTAGMLDGLLISHIRYQGFFGNIRATTRPISFDEASISELMTLSAFEAWRDAGGVLISDHLGSRAVRRFYDPSGLSFNARLVVRDAFLAGNDMLYLGDILDTGDEDSSTSVRRILEFFTQKYKEDVAFAQRVDQAVLRILALKFTLYDTFTLDTVLPDPGALSSLGTSQQTVFDIARAGATLISPGFEDLENLLPDAPGLDDRLVFFTDTNPFQQCSTCPLEESIPRNALENVILQLYGPEAGNQIQRRNLISYTFEELATWLDDETTSSLENNVRNAGWIVFAMQDVDQQRPNSLALRRLLSERDDLIRGKRIVVFAFNAPYFLDATDISKLTAYYALYTKTPEAVDLAARILFKEVVPSLGDPPVSINGIGYDLISATSPDPEQQITLKLISPEITPADPQQDPPPPLEISLGETLVLETGVILDHNGHPVPDGTPVQFSFNLNGVETLSPQIITTGGVARTSYVLSEPGSLQIGVHTEPGAIFTPLLISIPTPEGFSTPAPPTEEPTPIAEDTALPTPVATQPGNGSDEPIEEPRTETDFIDWTLALIVSLTGGWITYRIGAAAGLTHWSIRWGLGAAIGGLLVYLYLALGLNGSADLVASGRGAVVWATVAGALLGWGASVGWYALTRGISLPKRDR